VWACVCVCVCVCVCEKGGGVVVAMMASLSLSLPPSLPPSLRHEGCAMDKHHSPLLSSSHLSSSFHFSQTDLHKMASTLHLSRGSGARRPPCRILMSVQRRRITCAAMLTFAVLYSVHGFTLPRENNSLLTFIFSIYIYTTNDISLFA